MIFSPIGVGLGPAVVQDIDRQKQVLRGELLPSPRVGVWSFD